jgi:nucleotide-binding universal stress UspA family protein
MLSTVLLPTDLSAPQELVMRFAAGLPDLGVRRVVCCHVVDATGLEGQVIAAKVDAAREHLERATKPLIAAGLEVESRIATGDPERELLNAASSSEIDGLVCGSSGKTTTADRIFMGSVSERLVRDGGVPSLTVRYDLLRTVDDPADLARRFGRVVLVPTDFSATAARALNVALSLPRKSVGMLRIFNVLPNGDGDGEAEAQLRKLVDIAKGRGLTASPVIGHGAPEKAILREVQESGITGVVVGSRGRSILQEALMGSVSMTLMRQAPCPVLIVP